MLELVLKILFGPTLLATLLRDWFINRLFDALLTAYTVLQS